MDKLTEEIFTMWLNLYNQEDYCMSGVTSPQRYEAPNSLLWGIPLKLHYNTISTVPLEIELVPSIMAD